MLTAGVTRVLTIGAGLVMFAGALGMFAPSTAWLACDMERSVYSAAAASFGLAFAGYQLASRSKARSLDHIAVGTAVLAGACILIAEHLGSYRWYEALAVNSATGPCDADICNIHLYYGQNYFWHKLSSVLLLVASIVCISSRLRSDDTVGIQPSPNRRSMSFAGAFFSVAFSARIAVSEYSLRARYDFVLDAGVFDPGVHAFGVMNNILSTGMLAAGSLGVAGLMLVLRGFAGFVSIESFYPERGITGS